MARKKTATKTTGSDIAKTNLPDGLMNEAPVSYPVAGTSVVASQVWHNPDRRPSDPGPWDGEADKVAWIDDETGLGCIMLRQVDGTLSGYVGVTPDHPLFGFKTDALPVDLASSPHGGITYARPCEVNRFERQAHGRPRQERYNVCHVTRTRLVQDYRTVQTTDDEFAHEDLWWFGFDTNHAGDLVPKLLRGNRRKGDVYRDQAFVYANVIELARLMKVAEGGPLSGDEKSTLRLPPPDVVGGEK